MAKQKKRRNKKYSGQDAAVTKPTIVRVTASNRPKIVQWFYERKQFLRPAIIALVVVIVIVLVVLEIVHLATS